MKKNLKQDLSYKLTDLEEHERIMEKLSMVRGERCSFFHINGYCYFWSVQKPNDDEITQIAQRGNHEELMLMIEKYGQAAPPKDWNKNLYSSFLYTNDHILPDAVQVIIAERLNPDEIKAYLKYQGFGQAGQAAYFERATHEQRMYYLKRHGLTPLMQKKLRETGIPEEIDLHISRHGMSEEWEKELTDGPFQDFEHAITLHEFSPKGQCYLNQKGSPAYFAAYILHWGQWEKAHKTMVENRTQEELKSYISRHRYLSREATLVLCKTAPHDLMMHYILNGVDQALNNLLEVFEESQRKNNLEKLWILQKTKKQKNLASLEAEFFENGTDEDIIEYLNMFCPLTKSAEVLLQNNRLVLFQKYLQKWKC